MLCPYCKEKLETANMEMKCVKCLFHIDNKRFKMIMEHRAYPSRDTPHLYWQNLIDYTCPMDGSTLYPVNEAGYDVSKCAKDGCTFSIKDKTLIEILRDPNHPANRFYKQHDRR